jgi:alkylhydroperoxidase family enzyme
MAWIRTVPPEEATGKLATIYAQAQKRAGRVFGILRVQSLDPTILEAMLGLYIATTTTTRSPLPRWFRELIAVEVSRANECFY